MIVYELPFKTVHRLMKQNTDCNLSHDSVEQLILFLESVIKNVTISSSLYADHDDRKTIDVEDINLAIRQIYFENKK